MSQPTKNTFDVSKIRSKVRAAIELHALNSSEDLEAEAKLNAPWTDDTSNARNSIQGSYGWEGKNKMVVMVSGNVDYFIWLELAMEKKWAILYPTVKKLSPEIIKGFAEVIK